MTPETPIAAIPLIVGDESFRMRPTMSARETARLADMPDGKTNVEAIEMAIENIAAQMIDDAERKRFSKLWDRPEYTQGMLLGLYQDVLEHYARRPTDGPLPSSIGSGTPTAGENSTAASSSPEEKDSTPSPMTLAG